MAVFLSPVGGAAAQFFDNNGIPLAGGLIYTYTAGTSTPAATYTTSAGTIQHSNPIILDAAGRVPTGEIWLTDGIAYKFVVKTAQDVLIATYDNITGINSNFVAYTSQQEIQTATAGQTVFTLTTMQYQPSTNNLSVFVDGVNQYGPGAQYAFTETDSETVTFVTGLHVGASVKFTTASPVASAVVNAENVAYTPPFAGSVTTNVETKLSEYVSVKDFGAVGDGVTNDTTAIQNAVDYVSSINGSSVYFPNGTYLTDVVEIPSNVIVDGNGVTIKANINQNYIFRIIGDNVTVKNCIFDCVNLSDVNTNPIDSGLKSSVLYIRVGTGPFLNIGVYENRFINIPTTSQDFHAIGFNEANAFVENNYVDQCGGDILNFNGGWVNVNNNQLFNGNDGGIALNNGARGNISNNYVYKCSLGAGCGPEGQYPTTIYNNSMTISGNTFDSCYIGTNFGWYAIPSSWGPVNWSIVGNNFFRCDYGIRYDGDSSVFVANGVIDGNVFYRTGDGSWNGTPVTDSNDIAIVNCAQCVISNNTMNEAQGTSTQTGIWIVDSPQCNIIGNKISHSVSYTNAIHITSCQYGAANNNVITNCQRGIIIDGTGTQNTVSINSNSITNYTSVGIYLLNASIGTIIKGNELLTNGAVSVGIDLSANVQNISVVNNTVRQTGLSTNCITLNTSVVSNNYQISYNTVFGGTITDSGPVGATKNITGNW